MSEIRNRWIASTLLGASIISLAGPCPALDIQLQPGLFDRWVSLEKGLENPPAQSTRPGGRGESELDMKQEAETIERQYSAFVSQVAENAYRKNAAGVSLACKGAGADPIGVLVCRVAYYVSSGRKSARLFVKQFPRSRRELHALWMLDRIPFPATGAPIFFSPYGLTDFCINELYRIVQSGNSDALDVYLGLYCAADGEYAEFMQGELETLFRDQIEVVLKNWARFKRCQNALSNLEEELSADQKQEVLINTRKHCSVNQIACKELGELFSH